MKTLVLAQYDDVGPRAGSLSALGFARQVTDDVSLLVIGSDLSNVSQQASRFATTLVADDPALENPTADRWAKVVADVARDGAFDLVVAASTTLAKDIVPRAAALLRGAMASDVVAHEIRDGELILRRPMFAGAVLATVRLHGAPQVVTIRASAYEPAEPLEQPGEITAVPIDAGALPSGIEYIRLDSRQTGRPDVTEARIVVSGGRALKNSDDFERLVGVLADRLGGATGSSRALVDSGITPNDMQVGQTGKIVAPELYLALGISGAVQHLAGMKNSKVIAAGNCLKWMPVSRAAAARTPARLMNQASRPGQFRSARITRALQRRIGAANGRRVPVSTVGRRESGNASKPQRPQDPHALPALLEQFSQRLPATRRSVGCCPPQPVSGRVG